MTTTLPPETALHGLLLDECASLQETPPIGTRNNANDPISVRDFDYRHDTGFSIIEFDHQEGQRQSVALRRGESKEYEVVRYVNVPFWPTLSLQCLSQISPHGMRISSLACTVFGNSQGWRITTVRICSAFIEIRLEAERLLGYSES